MPFRVHKTPHRNEANETATPLVLLSRFITIFRSVSTTFAAYRVLQSQFPDRFRGPVIIAERPATRQGHIPAGLLLPGDHRVEALGPIGRASGRPGAEGGLLLCGGALANSQAGVRLKC